MNDKDVKFVLTAVDKTTATFDKFQRNLSGTNSLAERMQTGLAALAATSAATIAAAYVAFDNLVKRAGDFQDMAEKTGDTAQNMASLAVSAGVAATSMDEVTGFAIRLSKNLTGVDDESKNAGAAITALGLNLRDFKELKSADQIEAIAKALKNFNDEGGGKTSVLEALSKGGAQLLPFLKELGQEGGRQVILTQAQIEAADEYADKQAKVKTEIGLTAQSIATKMIPQYTALSVAVLDVAKETLGLKNGISSLTGDRKIQEFASSAAQGIAILADGAFVVGKMFAYIGDNIGATAAQAAALGRLDFSAAGAIGRASIAANESFNFSLGLADKVQTRLAELNKPAVVKPVVQSNEDTSASGGDGRKTLEFDGTDAAAKAAAAAAAAAAKAAAAKAAQEASARTAAQIALIKKAGELEIGVLGNKERIIEALRTAGLIDERSYYANKRELLLASNAAQEETLQKEIARLQSEKLSGKAKIENDKKIADAQSDLSKQRQTAATNVAVLSIQEAVAMGAVTQAYRDAEDAARSYLDTLRLAQSRDLSGMGQGDKERSRISGRAQIEDKYTQQRQDLDKSRRDAELAGTFGPAAQAKYDDELDRIKRFSAIALSEYDAYFAKRTEQEGNWAIGANEAISNYLAEAQNVAAQSQQAFENAFKGMEDSLVTFITTGKLSFTSLADSIVADITRIIVKQQIANAATSIMSGGGMGIIGSIIGAVSGSSGVASAASAMSGDSLDNMLKLTNNFAGRAGGGSVAAGGVYRVNEKGPELLNVAGEQYLMMGPQGGSVTPNSQIGGGNTVHVSITQQFAPGTTRATTMQAAAEASRQLSYAGRNL